MARMAAFKESCKSPVRNVATMLNKVRYDSFFVYTNGPKYEASLGAGICGISVCLCIHSHEKVCMDMFVGCIVSFVLCFGATKPLVFLPSPGKQKHLRFARN